MASEPVLTSTTLVAARPTSGSERGPHTGCLAQASPPDKTAACAASGQRTPDTRLGTPLDDPARGDLEEMPADHGNEGLKLAARVIRAPTLH